MALRVAPGVPAETLDRLRERDGPVQVRQHFCVPESLKRWQRPCVPGSEQGTDLLLKTLGDLLLDSHVDARVEFLPVKRQGDHEDRSAVIRRLRAPSATLPLEQRDWGPGVSMNLERTDDPPHVPRMNPGRGHGIHLPEAAVQRTWPGPLLFIFESDPKLPIGRYGRDGDSVHNGVDVQASPPNQERQAPARADLAHGRRGQALVLRECDDLIRSGNVEQMVRDSGSIGTRRLGRADIQAAVRSPGIGADDFRRNLPGQSDRDLRLPDPRRAGDDDEGRDRYPELCAMRGAAACGAGAPRLRLGSRRGGFPAQPLARSPPSRQLPWPRRREEAPAPGRHEVDHPAT